MASRILGMGDVLSLIERAQDTIDETKAKEDGAEAEARHSSDFDDYLESMNQMKNMGGISKILSMMPGVGGAQLEAAGGCSRRKTDGADRSDYSFHDTEGAGKSGSFKSIAASAGLQMEPAWISEKSTSW